MTALFADRSTCTGSLQYTPIAHAKGVSEGTGVICQVTDSKDKDMQRVWAASYPACLGRVSPVYIQYAA